MAGTPPSWSPTIAVRPRRLNPNGLAMFEEAQLYSPVTTDEDGEVTVHLIDGHPGLEDPEYQRRRNAIAAAALAWVPGTPSPQIDYTDVEHEVWRTVCEHLAPLHDRYAYQAFRKAVRALDLPRDRVPQLDEVSAGLEPLTGFSYIPAPGIVPLEEFYGSLDDGVFHSTQYLRHHAARWSRRPQGQHRQSVEGSRRRLLVHHRVRGAHRGRRATRLRRRHSLLVR
jgi:hypothetical protein